MGRDTSQYPRPVQPDLGPLQGWNSQAKIPGGTTCPHPARRWDCSCSQAWECAGSQSQFQLLLGFPASSLELPGCAVCPCLSWEHRSSCACHSVAVLAQNFPGMLSAGVHILGHGSWNHPTDAFKGFRFSSGLLHSTEIMENLGVERT
uniref:Uncharacterized protein n=1 Tax=Zosterops lateralis melanops TaxID=1220523 RepID=A0A8D2NXM7_ZOSLA